MTKHPILEFLQEDDETVEECVDRHLSEGIASIRRQGVAFITRCRGEGNVRSSDLAKIDAALEDLRATQRRIMLAQIESHGQPIN